MCEGVEVGQTKKLNLIQESRIKRAELINADSLNSSSIMNSTMPYIRGLSRVSQLHDNSFVD